MILARQTSYRPTAEDRSWFCRRLAWYGFQCLLFVSIVYRVGPNFVLFHSPFSPGPQYYVQFTHDYTSMIAAIKAYKRDFGELPIDSELPQEYFPPEYTGGRGQILNTTSITFPLQRPEAFFPFGVLEYEFSPEKEGWIVHSPRYNGPIPAPIVPAAPKPATQPATSPTSGPTSVPATRPAP